MIAEEYSINRALVLVTGGTGFIASHIIALLLSRGYSVRTTVRSLHTEASGHLFSGSTSLEYLRHLPGASEHLEIVEADLNVHESWEAAFAGEVEYVMHVASPHVYRPDNPQETLVNPAVNGTKSILQFCQNSPSVRKLVFTSCIQTLANEFDNSCEYNEESWNEAASLNRNSYGYSKTLAEREVMAFAQTADCHFSVVSIVAGVTLGPHLGGRLSQSHRFLLAFLEGKVKGVPNLHLNIADVRDIAMAHVVAMEKSSLVGRFCCCNKAVSLGVILQTLHENFNDLIIPNRKLSDMAVRLFCTTEKSGRSEYALLNLGRVARIKCAKAREAGMSFRPTIQTVVDTTRYLVESRNIDRREAGNRACVIM